MEDKIDAFIKKLGIWIIHLEKRNDVKYNLTSNHIDKKVNPKSPILNRILNTMNTYLRKFKIQLLEFFSGNNDVFPNLWVISPFDENIVAV